MFVLELNWVLSNSEVGYHIVGIGSSYVESIGGQELPNVIILLRGVARKFLWDLNPQPIRRLANAFTYH